MNTVKILNKGKTKIIAHRGVSGLEKENTAAAFVAAGNRSYYGIESDTHITADGHYVIMHDAETGRVACVNLNIPETSLHDLQQIVLCNTDGTADRMDLRIPLLKDYLEICHKYEKISVLELKDNFTDRQLNEIYDICSEYCNIDDVIFISFIYENVERIKRWHPSQRVQFLTGAIDDSLLEKLKDDKIDLDIYFGCLTPEWINRCHSVGILVNCWTVDDPVLAEKLISDGVDFITSNILE